ncbi:MAG: hypothetical protein ACYTFW_25080 [Planctomycetota bacterium]|jgi:hypothetical protein
MAESWRLRIARLLGGPKLAAELASVRVRVDDSTGWESVTTSGHDRAAADIEELYRDSLTAWRKNPMAFRIVQTITDFVVGDKIIISSEDAMLQKFLVAFWDHPENYMENRLESMCEELSRAGDLFVLLFQNKQDGMSYVRFITKDQVSQIKTALNDWEKELVIVEKPRAPGQSSKNWYTFESKMSKKTKAIILHYAVNKPIGALLGEGDLNVNLPWMVRYSRMLEDRVRLNWGMRAFLWVLTVPTNKIAAKKEQYKKAPEPGAVVVKDEGEQWEALTPNLRGADASHDLRAVRQMIDAGSGQPPHWRGEGENVNLATAQAMQSPVERHLMRRQKYFTWMLQDIVYHAYQRAVQAGKAEQLGTAKYDQLFTVGAPDISRRDNVNLAKSARDLTLALKDAANLLPGDSSTFDRLMLQLTYKFLGEPQDDETIDQMMSEAGQADKRGENEQEKEK